MSGNKEILDRIATIKGRLHTSDENAEMSSFANKPKLAEKVNGFGGKVLSPMKEYAAVQSPSKSEMRAMEFGFSPLAKGSTENVAVDKQLVQNLQASRSNNFVSKLKDKSRE